MEIIQTTNISRRYVMGEEIIQALKDVTISVNQGEYVAFMGPSGSGKIYVDEYYWLLGHTHFWTVYS